MSRGPRTTPGGARIAFVTWRGLPGLSADDRLAAAAVASRGAGVARLPAPWLYARVDACEVNGALVLMELELIEPTLFFHADPSAPTRFAQALRA